MALRRADPALLAEHDRHRFARHQFGLVQRLRRIARDQRRTARVAELLRIGEQFVLDQLLQLRLAVQRGDELLAFLRKLVLLAADLHFLQARELLQARLEDVVGLVLAEREARDQRVARLVLGADDADDFIEVEERDQQAFQQVQAALDLFLAMLQAAHDGVGAEHQPFAQQHP